MTDRREYRHAEQVDDRAIVARALLDLAAQTGLDTREIRATGHGFSVPAAWADEYEVGAMLAAGIDPADYADYDEAEPDAAAVSVPRFDPSEHSAPEVVAHLQASDFDEQTRVLAAEMSGKNRATIARWRPAE